MTEELRITKIEKVGDLYKLHVDLYKLGMSYDEYKMSGFLFLSDIESFDPECSVEEFVIN